MANAGHNRKQGRGKRVITRSYVVQAVSKKDAHAKARKRDGRDYRGCSHRELRDGVWLVTFT